MEYRRATIDDVDSINELFLLAIKRREFPESMEEAQEIIKDGKKKFQNSPFRIFVAVEDGKVMAYVLYNSYLKVGNMREPIKSIYKNLKDCAYILAFMAHPDVRGKDVAMNLVKLVLKDAKKAGFKGIYCTASKDNIRSRKFQLKCGFKEILIFKDPKRRDGDTTVLFYQDI